MFARSGHADRRMAARIVMRSAMPPEQMADSLRAAVRSIDPQLPLTQVESMDRVVAEGQAPRRFNAALISSFAAAAVLLGDSRHLQRDCIFGGAAHPGDGDSPGAGIAALQRHEADSGFRREARPGGVRHRRNRRRLRDQAAAFAAVSGGSAGSRGAWCWRRSEHLCAGAAGFVDSGTTRRGG